MKKEKKKFEMYETTYNDVESCEDECNIFMEPSDCIEIQSLQDELVRYKDLKPIDIYLDHCHQFSDKNMKLLTKDIDDYKYNSSNVHDKLLSL